MVLRDMSPPGRRSDVCDVRGSHDVTTLVEQPEQRSDAPCCVNRTATVRQDETCCQHMRRYVIHIQNRMVQAGGDDVAPCRIHLRCWAVRSPVPPPQATTIR